MSQCRLSIAGHVAGISMSSILSRTASSHIGHEVELPAALVGALTTRTGDDEGTLTMGADHGIETADTLDVYWDGGRRYGMTVGTVAGTSVPISGGAGDVLPADETAITAQVPQVVDTDFVGNLLAVVAALCAENATVYFKATGGGSQFVMLLSAGQLWLWMDETSLANPFTDKEVSYALVSHGGSSPATVKVALMYNADEGEED